MRDRERESGGGGGGEWGKGRGGGGGGIALRLVDIESRRLGAVKCHELTRAASPKINIKIKWRFGTGSMSRAYMGLVIQQKANDKWRFGAVKCHELTRAA